MIYSYISLIVGLYCLISNMIITLPYEIFALGYSLASVIILSSENIFRSLRK